MSLLSCLAKHVANGRKSFALYVGRRPVPAAVNATIAPSKKREIRICSCLWRIPRALGSVVMGDVTQKQSYSPLYDPLRFDHRASLLFYHLLSAASRAL